LSAQRRAPVSAVIAAHNEAANIEACIASLDWVSEVLVVENDSTDETAEIARRNGAIVHQLPFTTIGGQRNFAIERAKNEWVLVVDADERCTPDLAATIARITNENAAADAYRIGRRNFFLGKEIRHGGWSADRDHPVRLFRKSLRYNDSKVHEHVVVEGVIATLKGRLEHRPYRSLDDYFQKFNRYSRSWAEQNHNRGRRAHVWDFVIRPPLRFLTTYLLQGGWMDGGRGALLAALSSASVMAKYARLWEMSLRRK
jgi:glycosyltransferase involved in cell wall biosynthesis